MTAQRRGKLGSNKAAIKWSDIKDGVWTINAEDREKGTVEKIRLPKLALDVLKEQPRIDGNPYVFTSANGNGPFSTFSLGMTALRDGLPDDMPSFSMHDLRRTARKLMSRADVRPDVAELALGHSLLGLQKIYDDVEEYEPMVDAAFQSVANEIETILKPRPPNVVPFARSG